MNTPVSLLDSPTLQKAYLLVSKEIQSIPQTFVFSIDKITGGIYHAGIPNVDIFSSQGYAIQYLTDTYNFNQATIENLGQSLIGATIFDNKLVILCVQKQEEAIRIFDQPIYNITDISYTFIELNPKSLFKPSKTPILYINSYTQLEKCKKVEIKNDSFLKFNIYENHFYSPTLDMNYPFPYKQHTTTNGPFCWNKRFLIPFEDNNCLKSCVIVFQGGIYTFKKENASITYIIKRSSMFPGTRYNSRGLKITSSKKVETANECECDLIFSDGSDYYSQTWRRGSPPIFWKSDMTFLLVNNSLPENASEMTSSYFYQHIIKRFKPSRVQVVSLLSNKEETNERKFNDALEKGFKSVEFVTKNNDHVNFGFTRFDINRVVKASNKDYSFTSSEMFRLLQNPIECSDFTKVDLSGITEENETENVDTFSGSESIESNNSVDDKDNKNIVKKKLKFNLVPINAPNKQSVVFRFNCADSLDRTNLGTFFYGVLITAKFVFQKNIYCFMNQKAHQIKSKSGALWKNPFEYLSKEVIDFLKDSFIKSGNIISQFYTSTNAIKSDIIELASNESSQNSSQNSSSSSDSLTSLVRRIKNCFSDPIKQHIIEEWTRTFQIKNPRFVLDQQHLSFCELNQVNCDHSIFELSEKDFVVNSNESITAMFPEPLFLYQVSLLIFRKNINENTTITLSIGNNKKDEHVFFKDLLLPTINPKISNKKQNPNDCYVWVTYNLRKIAAYSNIYPVEPESLKLSSFVNLQFSCKNTNNDSKIRIGNIKFVVKKPNSTFLNQMKKISSLNPQEASTQLLKINNTRCLNSHRYMLSGSPIAVDGFTQKELVEKIYNESFKSEKDYFEISQTANKSIDYSILPSLDELTTSIMKCIQYGVSDYNIFQSFVDHCANPWIFNLGSRINIHNHKKNCPICGKKINYDEIINSLKKETENDRELLRKSTVYMPNPVFPLFYIKTINLKLITEAENNVAFLCTDCSNKYDELIKSFNIKNENKNNEDEVEEDEEDNDDDDEILDENDDELDDLTIQSNIISNYINNFVKINDVSDTQQCILPISLEDNVNDFFGKTKGKGFVELNQIARIYDYPQNLSADELNLVLHSSIPDFSTRIPLDEQEVEFSVCFASFVLPIEVEFIFAEKPAELFDLNVKVQGFDENVAFAKEEQPFVYEIRFPKNEIGSIQSMTFKIKSEKKMNLILNEIKIKGFIDTKKKTNNQVIKNFEEVVQLPNFSQTKNDKWNLTMRSQSFLPSKYLPKKISGISVYFPTNKYASVPKYFIVAFYLDKKIVHTVKIVLPTDVSDVGFIHGERSSNQLIDHFYFPISDGEFNDFDFDFDLISVFYVEKSSIINQISFMFF